MCSACCAITHNHSVGGSKYYIFAYQGNVYPIIPECEENCFCYSQNVAQHGTINNFGNLLTNDYNRLNDFNVAINI